MRRKQEWWTKISYSKRNFSFAYLGTLDVLKREYVPKIYIHYLVKIYVALRR